MATCYVVSKPFGTDMGDVLTGTPANNWIHGNAGADVIDGAAGNDSLFGGSENEFLIGGQGPTRCLEAPGATPSSFGRPLRAAPAPVPGT